MQLCFWIKFSFANEIAFLLVSLWTMEQCTCDKFHLKTLLCSWHQPKRYLFCKTPQIMILFSFLRNNGFPLCWTFCFYNCFYRVCLCSLKNWSQDIVRRGEREERRQISKRSNITKATSTWDTILPLEASLSSQFQHRIADFSKYSTTIGPWKKCPWTFSECPNDENINKRAPSIVETLQKNSHLDSISIALKLKIRRVSNTLTTTFLLFNVVFLFSWNKAPFSFVQIKWCEFKLVLILTLEIRISNTGLQSFQRWEMIIGSRF